MILVLAILEIPRVAPLRALTVVVASIRVVIWEALAGGESSIFDWVSVAAGHVIRSADKLAVGHISLRGLQKNLFRIAEIFIHKPHFLHAVAFQVISRILA